MPPLPTAQRPSAELDGGETAHGCASHLTSVGQRPCALRSGAMHSDGPVIPTQILRVLSSIRQYDVRALLMGGGGLFSPRPRVAQRSREA